jgi:hypothetical protein
MATINGSSTTADTSVNAAPSRISLLGLPIKVRERIYHDLLDLPMNQTRSPYTRRYWEPTRHVHKQNKTI